jgi:guanylate kinase
MKQIMYCATPTRIRHLQAGVKALARANGFAPVFPFDCAPYDDFEGDPKVGRYRTLKLNIDFQNACDVTGVFGISKGVLGEINNALNVGQPIRTFPHIDLAWDTAAADLKGEYGDPLARVRGPYELVVVVGPRAIGKTYWIHVMIQRYSGMLRRVKTTTTRAPRDDSEYDSYIFVSEQEFLRRLENGEFLEYDLYRGARYASSLPAIREVLQSSHGIVALTPRGVEAVWNLRYECNVRIVRFVPFDDAMLMRNLDRRQITDTEQRMLLVEHAREFSVRRHIPYEEVMLYGVAAIDESKVRSALTPRTYAS